MGEHLARARPGRRPGESGTRDAILAAARRQFAALGYDRTSMRQVALEAGVDPALVTHFHGSKQQLFVAAVGLPLDPGAVIDLLSAGEAATVGERLARFLLEQIATPQGHARIVGVLRAAASEPEAARMVREALTRELLTPLVSALGSPDAAYRAALVQSQIVGLVLARDVVGLEPLAARTVEDLVAAVGPTLQRYLTGPLR